MTLSKYTELAPGLTISRSLTGLWQIADLERDGNKVNALEAAKSMKAYVDAGFTTFDMADHYGSCLLYTSPSPRDRQKSRMPSSA